MSCLAPSKAKYVLKYKYIDLLFSFTKLHEAFLFPIWNPYTFENSFQRKIENAVPTVI